MDKRALKKSVLEYIRKTGDVSYAELQWYFGQLGFNYHGDLEIYSPINENVIFWCGWNQEAIEVMNELKSENLIEQEPVQPLIYLIDGAALRLPIVRKAINYKSPHWLPLVYHAVKDVKVNAKQT